MNWRGARNHQIISTIALRDTILKNVSACYYDNLTEHIYTHIYIYIYIYNNDVKERSIIKNFGASKGDLVVLESLTSASCKSDITDEWVR